MVGQLEGEGPRRWGEGRSRNPRHRSAGARKAGRSGRRALPGGNFHRGRGSAEPRRAKGKEKEMKKPKLAAPRGACDTHMHFYDEKAAVAPGTFMPGHFAVEDYRAMQKRLGLERVIVVQPNAYADDNRVTLD